MHTSPPTTPHRHNHHFLISQLKNRITHRHDQCKREKVEDEKNNGFVYIDGVDNETMLVSVDHADQQKTRHPEPCEHSQIDDDIVDISYNHLESSTPATPTQASGAISLINRSFFIHFFKRTNKQKFVDFIFRFA